MGLIREADIDLAPILGKTVAVVGYGNQGRAHALNLRDSGLSVEVGSRAGKSREKAAADGFPARSVEEAVADAHVVLLTVPDESAGSIFDESVRPALRPAATLVFAHGFAVTYGLVVPPSDAGCVLVSPAGPGTALRQSYVEGHDMHAYVAVTRDGDWPLALAYGRAIGCARAGLIETTFREETECDLFGEQAVLCGGMPELAGAAFDTLVEAGYQPEVAYIECVHQVSLLADLMARYGMAGMRQRISDTAEFGAGLVGRKVVGQEARRAMKDALSAIQSGDFARQWLQEARAGKHKLEEFRAAGKARPVEAAFRRVFGDDG